MENPMAASIGTLIERFALYLRPDACTKSRRPSLSDGLGGQRRTLPPRSSRVGQRMAAPSVAIPSL